MSNETTALEQTAANLFLLKVLLAIGGPALKWIELDMAGMAFPFSRLIFCRIVDPFFPSMFLPSDKVEIKWFICTEMYRCVYIELFL